MAGRNEARGLTSVEDVLKSNQRRVESDRVRYTKYFQIDVLDENNYDWVLDTSELTEEEAFQKVREFVQSKLDVV